MSNGAGRTASRVWAFLPVFLISSGCLERITDNPPPLDPRFYTSDTMPTGEGAGNETLVPFVGYDGPWVDVKGVIHSDMALPVDMDLWQVDPTAPGNREHLGKVPLNLPGEFSLQVPEGFGGLMIEAFHDVKADGPSDDDPFGYAMLVVENDTLNDVDIVLVAGARSQVSRPLQEQEGASPDVPPGAPEGPQHVEAPPGAPGGADHPHQQVPPPKGDDPGGQASVSDPEGAPHPWEHDDPFASWAGERVTIRGVIEYGDNDALLDLDIFRGDPEGPGGRAFAGKLKRPPGPFQLSVPVSFEEIMLEVFLDLNGDGPTPDDPFTSYAHNPISLTGGDVNGVTIVLP